MFNHNNNRVRMRATYLCHGCMGSTRKPYYRKESLRSLGRGELVYCRSCAGGVKTWWLFLVGVGVVGVVVAWMMGRGWV